MLSVPYSLSSSRSEPSLGDSSLDLSHPIFRLTFVVRRKSKIGRVHRSSAKRSRILKRSFPLRSGLILCRYCHIAR